MDKKDFSDYKVNEVIRKYGEGDRDDILKYMFNIFNIQFDERLKSFTEPVDINRDKFPTMDLKTYNEWGSVCLRR